MTRPIPKFLVAAIASALAAVGLLTGILADFGAPLPWIVAATVVAVAVALVGYATRDREPVLAEVILVILVAGIAVLGVWIHELRAERQNLRGTLARERAAIAEKMAQPRVFDFIVYAGEPDPRNAPTFSDTVSDTAYARIAPADSARVADDGEVNVGTHVKIVCMIPISDVVGPNWYKREDGNFMHGGVIRLAPRSGQPFPPLCPGSDG